MANNMWVHDLGQTTEQYYICEMRLSTKRMYIRAIIKR